MKVLFTKTPTGLLKAKAEIKNSMSYFLASSMEQLSFVIENTINHAGFELIEIEECEFGCDQSLITQ